MVKVDKCGTCFLILMGAVNWVGNEKVMDNGAVTLSLYLMMSYKILCCLRKKCPLCKNPERFYFPKFQLFIQKY